MTTIAKREAGNDLATVERTRDNPVYTPRFDIWETEEELTLCGDLPGVGRDDLDIRFENGQLLVHGKVQERPMGPQYVYREYGIGDFYRSFTIGEMIDSKKIAAELRDGVLTLHLPKTEEVRPRRITVQT